MTNKSLIATLGAAMLISTGASAQGNFPEKPVRVVMGFPAGSGADYTARVIGQKLSELWGKPVLADNIVGAAGSIAAERVTKSAPDGYTLFFTGDAAMTSNVTLYPKLSYDPLRDFAHITIVVETPNVLVVHPSMPVKTVKELTTLARTRPGEITYASAGSGTSQHLGGVLLSTMAKVNLVHVPYKAVGQIMPDLLGGRIAMWFGNTLAVLPHVRSGKLRGIAVSSARRIDAAKDIPTVAESGLSGFNAVAWFGLVAPAATPSAVLTKVNQDMIKVIAMADVRAKFIENGGEIIGNTPAQFTAQVKAEIASKGALIRASGAKVD